MPFEDFAAKINFKKKEVHEIMTERQTDKLTHTHGRGILMTNQPAKAFK